MLYKINNISVGMIKVKQTRAKRMYYLGAAIGEGQKVPGVDKTPDLLREARLF